MKGSRWRLPLRAMVLVYLGLLVVLPVGAIFYHAFEPGLGSAWSAFTAPDALHALLLTLLVVAIAVPLNTVFGVGVSLILARHRFPGAWLLDALIDIPLAISPVVIGLSLILVYGHTGWFGNWLAGHGITVIFSVPGIVMASAAVSLPYVVREVLPVLQEIGTEQEQAARTLGAGPFAVVPAHHAAQHPPGPGLRRDAHHGPGAGRVRSGGHRVGRHRRQDRDLHPLHRRQHRQPRAAERLRRRGGPVPGRPHRAHPPDADRPQPGRLAREGDGMSITVESISKRFGDAVALDDVSLEVPTGSLTALLGPSGGGKSTLLRIIAGLDTPDAGIVRIEGEDLTATPARSRGVGFCFQHYAPFRHLTVRRNVAFGLEIRHRPKAEIKARVDELLELVGLAHLGDRYPSQLSGGQRQRMALARALAIEPKVLLLDEPFGALDAQVRTQLRLWLRDLHDTLSVTTVLVTHDQEEAMEVADRLAIVNHGRLEQVGTPADMYDHPANEFVLTFLGPATHLDGEWVRPHDLVVHAAEDGKPTPAARGGHGGPGHPSRLRGQGGRGPRRRRGLLGPAQPGQRGGARPAGGSSGMGGAGRRVSHAGPLSHPQRLEAVPRSGRGRGNDADGGSRHDGSAHREGREGESDSAGGHGLAPFRFVGWGKRRRVGTHDP